MDELPVIFAAVYVLNVIPAFAPPTWIFLSFAGFNYPHLNPLLLALIAAIAATSGRATLAILSQSLIRNKLLSARTKENIDALKHALEHRKKQTAGALLVFSFTPLPSNHLFIAFGLTSLPIKLIAIPFFIGRLTSYTLWAFLGQTAYANLDIDADMAGGYLSVYFVLTQIVIFLLVYLFTKIDWHALLIEKKLKWLDKNKPSA